jgi:hypothetical protein
MSRTVRVLHAALFTAALLVVAAVAATPAPAATPTNPAVFSLAYGVDAEQSFTVVAAGPSGSFFAAGNRQSSRGDTDFILVKVRADGTVAWHREYDRPLWNEVPSSISVSAAGVVAVAGDTWKGPSDQRGLVLLWSTSGKLLWARQVKAATVGYADVDDVVADRYGRVFAAGRVWNDPRMADMEVTAYAKTGARLWQKLVDGGAKAMDFGHAIALDRAGNVYVGGNVTRTITGSAAAILKYTPAGRRLWLRTYDDGTARSHTFYDLAVRGSVVAACGYVADVDVFNGLVARYDTSGRRRWAYVVGDAFRETSYGSIALDAYSHIVVGGYQDFGAGGQADMLVSKFEPTGERAFWEWSWSGATASWDTIGDVAVTSEGQVYAAGSIGNADGTRDALIVHLTPLFSTDWMTRYGAGDEEAFSALVLDGKGVTAAGWSGGHALMQRFTLEVAP